MADRGNDDYPHATLAFSEMLWPDPQHGPWYVRAEWVDIDGQPQPAGLSLWHGAHPNPEGDGTYRTLGDGPHPITASDVRDLPIATMVDALRQKATDHEERYRAIVAGLWIHPDYEHHRDDLAGPRVMTRDAPRGPGRPRVHGADHYADVAGIYRQALARGDRAPTAAVARHKDVSRSTAAKWVAKARDLGFLGPTKRGLAGERRRPASDDNNNDRGKT